MNLTTTDFPAGHAAEILSRKRRGVYWSAIIGGAISATAVSIFLLILGVGLGFASTSSWYSMGPSAETLTLAAAIWMIVMQWLSSAFGGYITGRLRNRWHGFHADEGYFRDTVHGFLTWAVATIFVAVIVSSIASHRMHMYGGEFGGPHEAYRDHQERVVMAHDDHTDAAMQSQPDDMHMHGMSEEARKNAARFALFTAVAMLTCARSMAMRAARWLRSSIRQYSVCSPAARNSMVSPQT